jgi:hypothetical protein
VVAPVLDPSRIDSLGIQIYDKRDGPFRLEVDWIQAYRSRPAFSMSRYRWERRPLLVFAPSADDARLARQLADVARSRPDFEARDMVLVTIAHDGLAEAEGVALTAAETRALRERYGVAADRFAVKLVGKDGGVKRSDDAPVDMRSIYALIDTMPMRQREMQQR